MPLRDRSASRLARELPFLLRTANIWPRFQTLGLSLRICHPWSTPDTSGSLISYAGAAVSSFSRHSRLRVSPRVASMPPFLRIETTICGSPTLFVPR